MNSKYTCNPQSHMYKLQNKKYTESDEYKKLLTSKNVTGYKVNPFLCVNTCKED